MNDRERVRNLVNKYVQDNGNQTEMTRREFLEWVNKTYENISADTNNFYPTDISFNLYNAGLTDFPGTTLCLIFVEERKTFRLVGSSYKYTGPIYQYRGKYKEKIVGQWVNGVLNMEINDSVDSYLPIRRENLKNHIKKALKDIPVIVDATERNVTVHFHELLICGVVIEDESYKIYNASLEWKESRACSYYEEEDGTWSYYLDTIDECVDEIQRLVIFEARNGNKAKINKEIQSELSQGVTLELFKKAYVEFICQADKNANSKKSNGSKIPYAFLEGNKFDGANFSQHFGQGAASKTPYMNWWVVSIYYLVDSGNIILGIEEDRYSHLQKMKPSRFEQIGNKKTNIAVFYESTKDNINLDKLYEKFISVAEEVMYLGLT